jgi:hypothetical protein
LATPATAMLRRLWVPLRLPANFTEELH